MKVLMINSSPHPQGCTAKALEIMAQTFAEQEIETETVFIGNEPIADCIACGYCHTNGKCVFNDLVNEVTEKAETCDGFIFGSPVYYAHPTARLQALMDRAFFSAGNSFAYKPAAAVFSARRAGQVCSMDVINKYFTINQMPIVSSTYWNEVFGHTADQVLLDEEGVATMKNIALNMSWMLKCIEAGKAAGIERPQPVRATTNFHH